MTELQSEAEDRYLRCAEDPTLLCTSKEELLALLKKRSKKPAYVPKPRQRSWWWIKTEKGRRTSF